MDESRTMGQSEGSMPGSSTRKCEDRFFPSSPAFAAAVVVSLGRRIMVARCVLARMPAASALS